MLATQPYAFTTKQRNDIPSIQTQGAMFRFSLERLDGLIVPYWSVSACDCPVYGRFGFASASPCHSMSLELEYASSARIVPPHKSSTKQVRTAIDLHFGFSDNFALHWVMRLTFLSKSRTRFWIILNGLGHMRLRQCSTLRPTEQMHFSLMYTWGHLEMGRRLIQGLLGITPRTKRDGQWSFWDNMSQKMMTNTPSSRMSAICGPTFYGAVSIQWCLSLVREGRPDGKPSAS